MTVAVVLEMHACVGRGQHLCCLLFLPEASAHICALIFIDKLQGLWITKLADKTTRTFSIRYTLIERNLHLLIYDMLNHVQKLNLS